MKNKNNRLSSFQKEFIKKNYSTMKTNDICRELKLSYAKVHSYSSNLKLKKEPCSSNQYSHYFELLIKKRESELYNVDLYINKDIEKKIDKNLLYKSKYGKYSVNQDYFNKIDNEFKAYWLGFLYADGTNRIKRNNNTNKTDYILKLSLQNEDKTHLIKFKESIQSNAPVKDRKIKLKDKIYYSSDLNICNKNICESLEKMGCTPNKSLTLEFPNELIVPKNFTRDFIRGYFDGDGCIHINLENRACVVNMIGTEKFLKAVQKTFKEELNIDETKMIKKGNAYSISYGKYYSCEMIYNYLYKNCNIYLERKLKKFDTLFCLG